MNLLCCNAQSHCNLYVLGHDSVAYKNEVTVAQSHHILYVYVLGHVRVTYIEMRSQ
jgi:hypothetical protein